MKKILYVNHVAAVSGAERGLLDCVRALDRTRFTPLAALPGDGPLAEALSMEGVAIRTVPMRRVSRRRSPGVQAAQLVGLLRATVSIRRILAAEQIDLVHCNSDAALLHAGLAARMARIPCIWHSRDLVDLKGPGRAMGRIATCVLAISHSVATHITRVTHAPSKVRTLLNGIDCSRFTPRSGSDRLRRELGIPPRAFLAVNVGQLVPWKRQDLFIQSAGTFAGNAPDAHFLIVGEDLFGDHPDYRSQLLSLADSVGLGDRLHVLPWQDEIANVLATANVLVHTAEREPFGRVVAEAMAMARPVIAIDANGPAELIRNGTDGLLVPPDDAGGVAKALQRIASDHEYAMRLGQAACDRILANFAVERFASELGRLYDELLSGNAPT